MSYKPDEQHQRIADLLGQGVPESEVIKRLGLKRYEVRMAAIFEQGRRLGFTEAVAAANRANVVLPARLDVTGAGAAVSMWGSHIEALIGEIMQYLRDGKHVPERELREKFGVSGTALYKYRAVAADRMQQPVSVAGWNGIRG